MYEQIDGFSTCPDLRRVSCGASRQPWVPQHGVHNRPMYLNLVQCTRTWASGTSTEANLGQLRPT